MATLILSAAGAAIGGPLGGLAGSLIGRQIDRSFGGAKSRLSDLRAPSSQYGDPIAAVLRQMRVAGVVLWASAPVATATVSKSGTGQGSSVSFAYGLSSGHVENVDRVWADGRLIRDSEGRQDVSFTMRLHSGDEDQSSDPLIASLIGEELSPAFRGIAYLVFENFDLSSFGNRLPLITVEISGSGEPIIAEEVIRNALDLRGTTSSKTHVLEGCALSGDDAAEALAPLCEAFKPVFGYDGSRWVLGADPTQHVIDDHLWMLGTDSQTAYDVEGRSQAPTKVSVRFFDPAIDFQAGEKSARLPGVERLRRIELPAAMRGEHAKAVAHEQLLQASNEARALWLTLPLSYAGIQVGDEVCSAASPEVRFAVAEKALAESELRLRLRPEPRTIPSLPGDSGGSLSARMLKRSSLTVALVELPGSMFEAEPELAVLVSGGHEPFRPLPISLAIGGSETEMMSSQIPSPLGRLIEALPCSSVATFDCKNVVNVAFDRDPGLTSCTDDLLFGGANLLCVDGEFIQFGAAKPLGDAKYELSRLIRGRFDTASDTPHEAGAQVLLLDGKGMTTLKVPRDRIGSLATARAFGPEESVAFANLAIAGLAGRPWSPTLLRLHHKSNGLALSWVRRCKEGEPWLDGVDSPLGSSRELYSVTLSDALDGRIEVQSEGTSSLISPSLLAQLGPRPWRLEIRQVGDFAASRPLVHTLD